MINRISCQLFNSTDAHRGLHPALMLYWRRAAKFREIRVPYRLWLASHYRPYNPKPPLHAQMRRTRFQPGQPD